MAGVLLKSGAVIVPLLLLSKLHHLLHVGNDDVTALRKDGYTCFVSGDCLACSGAEEAQAYCMRTKRRQEMTCEKEVIGGEEAERKPGDRLKVVTAYAPCTLTSTDELTAVLRFQAVMAIFGGLAMYGVRHQKIKHLTLYEKRRASAGGGGGGGRGGARGIL